MDHDAVREALELAAAEPGGLDRLMAGDTPEAQAVAGHIAGCEACAVELERIGRVSAAVRASMAEVPAPDLKERTLAFVRAHGVPRGDAAVRGSAPLRGHRAHRVASPRPPRRPRATSGGPALGPRLGRARSRPRSCSRSRRPR